MLDIVRVSGPPVRSCGKGGEVSAYDLVIRAARVVDGNGGPPLTADVAITGGGCPARPRLVLGAQRAPAGS
jgi:hypothetical protein